MINLFLHNNITKAYGSKYLKKKWNGNKWVYEYNNSIGRIESRNFDVNEDRYQRLIADKITFFQESLSTNKKLLDKQISDLKILNNKINGFIRKNSGPHLEFMKTSSRIYKSYLLKKQNVKKNIFEIKNTIKNINYNIEKLNNYE